MEKAKLLSMINHNIILAKMIHIDTEKGEVHPEHIHMLLCNLITIYADIDEGISIITEKQDYEEKDTDKVEVGICFECDRSFIIEEEIYAYVCPHCQHKNYAEDIIRYMGNRNAH